MRHSISKRLPTIILTLICLITVSIVDGQTTGNYGVLNLISNTLSTINIAIRANGSNNGTISFGANFGAPALTLADFGAGTRYGWALQSGEDQNFIPTAFAHFSWNNGGDLQASGTNEMMRLLSTGAGVGTLTLASGGVYGMTNGNSSATCDTGLSRDSAGVWDVGNCTAGNKSGTINAATINVGGVPVIAPLSNAISSATGGTGISAVTCSTASCTNLRGTYTMTATAVSAGTILTLVWPTTTTAYACTVIQNGGSLSLGLGHSVATATGMTISNAVSAPLTGTIILDYSCRL